MDFKMEEFRNKLLELITSAELPAGVIELIMTDTLREVSSVHKQMVEQQRPVDKTEEVDEMTVTKDITIPMDDLKDILKEEKDNE